MTNGTLVWVITGSLLLTGFVLNSITKKVKFIKYAGLIFWLLGWLFLAFFKLFANDNTRYSLFSDIDLMKKYHLPQVDSSMALIDADKDKRVYVAYNFKRDSNAVFHFRKEITLDIFDVYKVRDEFVNARTGKMLTSIYCIPNWFRNSDSVYYINNSQDISDGHNDTVTRQQFMQIINDWGLKEKIFKVYHPYTYGVPTGNGN